MKFQDWMKKECKQVKPWLRKVGIPISSYYHILKGRDIKLSTALMIEKATKGEVRCEDICTQAAANYLKQSVKD